MTPVRPPHTPIRSICGARSMDLAGAALSRRNRAGPADRGRGAPLRYHRTGVGMSRTGHGSRPVPPATTVGLALLAAAITLWLGLVAQFGQMITGGSADGSADSTGRVPDRLAVVRVETGSPCMTWRSGWRRTLRPARLPTASVNSTACRHRHWPWVRR